MIGVDGESLGTRTFSLYQIEIIELVKDVSKGSIDRGIRRND